MSCKSVKFHSGASFILTAFLCAVSVFVFSTGAHALTAKPIFEVAIGDNSAEKLGKIPREEDVKEYDKYYLPSSFLVFEKLDLMLVLDSIKNRVCRYNLKGEFLGDFKFSPGGNSIDFAWFPSSRNVFFIFQDTSEMVLSNYDFASGKGDGASSSINILEAAGKKDCKDFESRKIWPAGISETLENRLILNVNAEFGTNLALSYKNGKLSKKKDIEDTFFMPASLLQTPALFSAVSDETAARALLCDIDSGATSSAALLPELTRQKGFGAKKISPAGSDCSNNLYLEAGFGESEDDITQNFIYKFDTAGRFLGRVEVFTAPEMLSNRFIAIGSEGGVFYMKKDTENNKIQFYKFEIIETK